jgi:hypothetical protein
LIRLKAEKQEKEDMIEYYRNRYEKYETDQDQDQAPDSAAVAALVGLSGTVERAIPASDEVRKPEVVSTAGSATIVSETNGEKEDNGDASVVSDLESESDEK